MAHLTISPNTFIKEFELVDSIDDELAIATIRQADDKRRLANIYRDAAEHIGLPRPTVMELVSLLTAFDYIFEAFKKEGVPKGGMLNLKPVIKDKPFLHSELAIAMLTSYAGQLYFLVTFLNELRDAPVYNNEAK